MQFAECTVGSHRIFVGALEAPGGDGYIAALVVRHDGVGCGQVVYRDDAVACGYRWPTPQEALSYALIRGREVAKRRSRELQAS